MTSLLFVSWQMAFETVQSDNKLQIIGVANGKYQTLRDRETSVFLCEPQPRSQGPLLLGPRVGEDPGNDVVRAREILTF